MRCVDLMESVVGREKVRFVEENGEMEEIVCKGDCCGIWRIK